MKKNKKNSNYDKLRYTTMLGRIGELLVKYGYKLIYNVDLIEDKDLQYKGVDFKLECYGMTIYFDVKMDIAGPEAKFFKIAYSNKNKKRVTFTDKCKADRFCIISFDLDSLYNKYQSFINQDCLSVEQCKQKIEELKEKWPHYFEECNLADEAINNDIELHRGKLILLYNIWYLLEEENKNNNYSKTKELFEYVAFIKNINGKKILDLVKGYNNINNPEQLKGCVEINGSFNYEWAEIYWSALKDEDFDIVYQKDSIKVENQDTKNASLLRSLKNPDALWPYRGERFCGKEYGKKLSEMERSSIEWILKESKNTQSTFYKIYCGLKKDQHDFKLKNEFTAIIEQLLKSM